MVGGLALLCRLSRPYRVTTDLDPVSRLQHGQTGQLPLLVAAGATLSGPSGVRLPTGLGPVQIDVLQVSDPDFDPPSVDALVAQPVAAGLQQAGQHLKDDALLHVARWFKPGRDRTLKRIRSIPEGATTTQDDLKLDDTGRSGTGRGAAHHVAYPPNMCQATARRSSDDRTRPLGRWVQI